MQAAFIHNTVMSFANNRLTKKQIKTSTDAEKIDILAKDYGIYWQNIPTEARIGSACSKGKNPFSKKKKWFIDRHMPLLDANNKAYLQDIVDSI
jgi:hypothetical protein